MANKVFDIGLDKITGDLLIKDGDFVIVESTEQHMSDLMISDKGNYKANPLIGVAIREFMLDDVTYSEELKREIMQQFENDGIEIGEMNIGSIDKIAVAGEYTKRKVTT